MSGLRIITHISVGVMDCLENESVCSVKKENNLGYYRIHTIWKDNGFRINIASRDGAWTGEMEPENVQSVCSKLNVNPDKYLAECREVLTTDDGKKGYFYAVENGSFTWKKMIDEDSGMKIRMGSVMVQPVSFVDTIQNIIEVALNCKKNLNKELKSLKQEKEGHLQRICQLKEKLEEICDNKKVMENDLYNKFLLLLNSKKRKIEELEGALPSIKSSVEKLEKLSESKNGKKNVMEETALIQAYDMDTDDEDDCQEKSTCSPVKNKLDGLTGEKNNCTTEQTVKSHPTCEVEASLENDLNCSVVTPDVDAACGSSSVICTSKQVLGYDDSKSAKDSDKSLLATKADILAFFFGPT